MPGAAPVVRVFISYAHESEAHAEAVRDLWVFLRANGVGAKLDRVAAQQRLDWTLWMEKQVEEADHILVIASPAYKRRAGPVKILAAVAAPEETATENAPLDVEAEMQALLDAVTEVEVTDQAQVRILEVASLAEITAALGRDQYHVLHLSAHGSPSGIELEDEDGNPEPADADELVAALRAGAHPLPVVVLSSCSGAAAGADGLAATLIRHGADRVLAMQTSVTDRYATDLARAFYRALAADPGCTVAAALATPSSGTSQGANEYERVDRIEQ